MPQPRCELCSRPVRHWLTVPGDWRRPRDRAEYHLWWCDACDHGQLSPRPADLGAAYGCDYYTHGDAVRDGRRRSPDRIWTALTCRLDAGRHLEAPRLAAHRRTPGRMLDIGCGDGALMRDMLGLGWECTGVEPDPGALARAREAGLDVVAGSAETLPDLGTFDVVVMRHALEHCADPRAAVRRAARSLEPGGAVFCEVPNNAAAGLRLQGAAWHWLDVPRHLHFFTDRSLAAVWRDAGLEVHAVEFCGYSRQFARRWREAERFIAERLGAEPPRSRTRLLLATALAAPRRRYDSVRIVAVSAAPPAAPAPQVLRPRAAARTRGRSPVTRPGS